VAGVLTFFTVMLRQRRRTEGLKRIQIGWIMVGFGAFGLVTATVSFLLPLFNIWTVTSLDSPSAFFFVAASFYAITRLRLLDLRIVVRKSFYYLVLAVFVFAVYYLNVYLDQNVFGGQYSFGALLSAVVIAPVFLLGYSYLSRLLQRFANKYFFSGLYDPQETIKEFASTISKTIKLDDVDEAIIDTLQSSLRVDGVAVAIRTRTEPVQFAAVKAKGLAASSFQALNSAPEVIALIQDARQPIVVEEQTAAATARKGQRQAQAFAEIAKAGVVVILPLALKDVVDSIVLFG
jgi:hypothetical protein